MSVFMRAVLADWNEPAFEDLAAFVERESDFRLRDVDGRGWIEFEALNASGSVVLAGDLTTGPDIREELEELEEFLEDLAGAEAAREEVRRHLRKAEAVVGLQILASVSEESTAAANAVIDFLEQWPGVLTQIDTVGWYRGAEVILQEPD